MSNVIVIESDNSDNLRLLIELAKKLGSKVATLSKDDVEDLALLSLMKKEKTEEKVSKATIMKKLKS